MLGLTGTLNYYLFNGSVDMRKGIYSLSDVVRHEMKQNAQRKIMMLWKEKRKGRKGRYR